LFSGTMQRIAFVAHWYSLSSNLEASILIVLTDTMVVE